MEFDWDSEKAEANLQKHRVSFFEGSEVLLDPLVHFVFDEEHSQTQERYLAIGSSTQGRILVVVFCERDEVFRIISARLATRRERREYEQGKW